MTNSKITLDISGTVNPLLSDIGCRARRGGTGTTLKPNPSNPHRGREWGATPRTPPGREGRAKINTRWVGNDGAGTRP